jgi:hypothetical protein
VREVAAALLGSRADSSCTLRPRRGSTSTLAEQRAYEQRASYMAHRNLFYYIHTAKPGVNYRGLVPLLKRAKCSSAYRLRQSRSDNETIC